MRLIRRRREWRGPIFCAEIFQNGARFIDLHVAIANRRKAAGRTHRHELRIFESFSKIDQAYLVRKIHLLQHPEDTKRARGWCAIDRDHRSSSLDLVDLEIGQCLTEERPAAASIGAFISRAYVPMWLANPGQPDRSR